MSNEHERPTDAELAEWDEEEVNFQESLKFVEMDIEQSSMIDTEDVRRLIAEVRWLRAERTLTLPNGVEVRAGDVLVNDKASKVAGVTAVGERQALGETLVLHDGKWTGMVNEHPLFTYAGQRDWRPWSSVYPDRPVPGGDG